MSALQKIKDNIQHAPSRGAAISSESLVNLFFEKQADEAKSPFAVFGTSGLKLFTNLNLNTPIWGIHYFNNYLYIVTNDSVYVVNSAGVATNLGGIGTVNQNVQIIDNFENIQILKPSGELYIATPASLTLVTDADYVPAGSMTVLDGYLILNKITAGNEDEFFISGLRNASSYDALKFANAEAAPDKIVRVFATLRDLLIFGENTIQVFFNSGNADFPFEPTQNGVIEMGCAAKLSVAQARSVVAWLGNDKSVYGMEGYNYKKISSFEIDELIRKLDYVEDAKADVYSEGGHVFYVLTFPTGDLTLVYDFSTGLWHRRKSFGAGRWRVNGITAAFGKNLAIDYSTSKIYEIDLDTYTEDGETIEREGITAPLFNNNNRFFVGNVQIDMEAGVGLLNGQGSNPQIMLQVSTDGGKTYSNEIWRTIGAQGSYKTKVIWHRLGYAYNMCFKYRITDPIKVIISGFYANIKTGIN